MMMMVLMMIEIVGQGDGLYLFLFNPQRERFGLHPTDQLTSWQSS